MKYYYICHYNGICAINWDLSGSPDGRESVFVWVGFVCICHNNRICAINWDFSVCYGYVQMRGIYPRRPCVKGAVSVSWLRDCWISLFYNPSVTALPCHLPLHRWGFHSPFVLYEWLFIKPVGETCGLPWANAYFASLQRLRTAFVSRPYRVLYIYSLWQIYRYIDMFAHNPKPSLVREGGAAQAVTDE